MSTAESAYRSAADASDTWEQQSTSSSHRCKGSAAPPYRSQNSTGSSPSLGAEASRVSQFNFHHAEDTMESETQRQQRTNQVKKSVQADIEKMLLSNKAYVNHKRGPPVISKAAVAALAEPKAARMHVEDQMGFRDHIEYAKHKTIVFQEQREQRAKQERAEKAIEEAKQAQLIVRREKKAGVEAEKEAVKHKEKTEKQKYSREVSSYLQDKAKADLQSLKEKKEMDRARGAQLIGFLNCEKWLLPDKSEIDPSRTIPVRNTPLAYQDRLSELVPMHTLQDWRSTEGALAADTQLYAHLPSYTQPSSSAYNHQGSEAWNGIIPDTLASVNRQHPNMHTQTEAAPLAGAGAKRQADSSLDGAGQRRSLWAGSGDKPRGKVGPLSSSGGRGGGPWWGAGGHDAQMPPPPMMRPGRGDGGRGPGGPVRAAAGRGGGGIGFRKPEVGPASLKARKQVVKEGGKAAQPKKIMPLVTVEPLPPMRCAPVPIFGFNPPQPLRIQSTTCGRGGKMNHGWLLIMSPPGSRPIFGFSPPPAVGVARWVTAGYLL
eukprot:gene23011-30202_t